MSAYVTPTVTDYGSLADLTAAADFAGPEDGGMKQPNNPAVPHHS